MKHTQVIKEIEIKGKQVSVEPFVPITFSKGEDSFSTIETLKKLNSKKNIRKIAKKNRYDCSEESILFAQNIVNSLLDEISHDK